MSLKIDPIESYMGLNLHSSVMVGDLFYATQGSGSYWVGDTESGQAYSGGDPWIRIWDFSKPMKPVGAFNPQASIITSTFYIKSIPQSTNPILWYNAKQSKLLLAMGNAVQLQITPNYNDTVAISYDEFANTANKTQWVATGVNETNSSPQWKSSQLKIDNLPAPIDSRNTYFDNDSQKGYVIGGKAGGIPTSSFLEYDGEADSWNKTALPWGSSSGDGILGSFKIRDRLLLFQVGGTVNGTLTRQDEVRIYDTVSKKWYTQKTSGDPPAPRSNTCFTSLAAPDKSSYQIYMYAGLTDKLNPEKDGTVWILNIPSFVWVQVEGPTKSDPVDFPDYFLIAPACQLVQNHYLVVFGGIRSQTSIVQALSDYESGGPGSILDLNTMSWLSAYDPKGTAYQVPQKVVSVIGGSPSGGATVTAPAGGFTNTELEKLLLGTSSPTGSQTGAPNPTDGTNQEPPAKERSPTAAIIGGVLGFLILIAFGVYLYMYLRKRHMQKARRMSNPVGGRNELPIFSNDLNYDEQLTLQQNLGKDDTIYYELSGEPVYARELHASTTYPEELPASTTYPQELPPPSPQELSPPSPRELSPQDLSPQMAQLRTFFSDTTATKPFAKTSRDGTTRSTSALPSASSSETSIYQSPIDSVSAKSRQIL
ncbi:hypothetical protein H072_6271 [Dactylellina haptotyla CBS 200.50]|uniref:Kelch repeat protein n=1 Tax=Dactylellina haptotyla (strain CBS 200.50) TaxID=1284197 RepID=S8AFG4_DACHA|nr:hypothetical protein H072_6271 [Dactylellina haptotyla CBS 200.50]